MVKTLENLRKRKTSGGRVKFSRNRRADESDSFSVDTLLGERSIPVSYTHLTLPTKA